MNRVTSPAGSIGKLSSAPRFSMGLFSSPFHSAIQRGYFPLFIFLICLFLLGLWGFFLFILNWALSREMGFGTNIWSETGRGEGWLGDLGGGGRGRQEQKQKSFFWVYFGCLVECRGCLAPRKPGVRRGDSLGLRQLKLAWGKKRGGDPC